MVTASTTTSKLYPEPSCTGRFTSCRWILAFMLFLLRMCQTALRQSIGMALVCMAARAGSRTTIETDQVSSYVPGNRSVNIMVSNTSTYDVHDRSDLFPSNSSGGSCDTREFNWDVRFEGIVLSSYYYGYMMTPLLAGYLERVVGAKNLIATSIGLAAVVNLVTPSLTRTHRYLLVALRVLAGSTNGMIDPGVQSLWAAWAPRSEVAYLTSVEYAGVSVGGIFTFLISGLLCQIPIDNGWPLIFYFYGSLNVLWLFLWQTIIFNNPDNHPRISQSELKYIHSQTHGYSQITKRKIHPPWTRILCSPPVWAIIIASATYMWVYSWILSYLPSYMENVLRFTISQNAVYSSLPFIGKFITGITCGYLADRLLKTRMSVEFNRKMFQMIGCLGCAVCMLSIGFLDHSTRVSAVALLVLAVALQNVTTVASRINVLDIAPRYSSFILGISSTAAVAFSMTAPLVNSVIVSDMTHAQCQIMFCVIAILCLVGGFSFLLLASVDLQPWAVSEGSNDKGATFTNGHCQENTNMLSEKVKDKLHSSCHVLTHSTHASVESKLVIEDRAASSLQVPELPDLAGDTTSQAASVPNVTILGSSLPDYTGSPGRWPRPSPHSHRLAAELVFDLDAAGQWGSSISLSG